LNISLAEKILSLDICVGYGELNGWNPKKKYKIYNVPQNSDSDLRWETSKPRTDKRGDPNEENTKKF